MQLPPLPDIFGNYAIRGIAEILPGPSISWFPATAGWKILLSVVLLLSAYLGWRRWRRWLRNRYRGAALARLRALEGTTDPAARLYAISRLLKATAMQAYPRPEVAPLHGGAWLQWLDGRTDKPLFSADSRRLLQQEIYSGRSRDAAAIAELSREAAQWILRHREPEHA